MQAFQQEAGLLANGQLSAETLAALRNAPTPTASERTARQGFLGFYKGTWRNQAAGMGGWSQFKVQSYDFNTGAIRGEMVMESEGVISTGVMTGRVKPGEGGQVRGQVHGSDGSGWDIQLTYNRSGTYDVLSGSFYSVPLNVLIPIPQSGTFHTKRVQ